MPFAEDEQPVECFVAEGLNHPLVSVVDRELDRSLEPGHLPG